MIYLYCLENGHDRFVPYSVITSLNLSKKEIFAKHNKMKYSKTRYACIPETGWKDKSLARVSSLHQLPCLKRVF
jgi:hypothetical protein